MTTRDVVYERPVKATLVVRLDNGDEWEATPEDLDRFGYSQRLDIYTRADRMLREGLGIDSWDGHEGPNLVRYLVECAICYKHSPWADENGEPWTEDVDGEAEAEASFKDQLRAVLGVAVGDQP